MSRYLPDARVRCSYKIVNGLCYMYFRLLYGLHIYGANHFKQGGGIIAANHTSYLDPPIVAASAPEEIHFLAKKELFTPFFGRFISLLNAHPIASEGGNASTMKHACQCIKSGKKVLIFPEGERSINGTLGEIKPGVGLLLSKTRSFIIPTYIHGAYEIWSRGAKMPKYKGNVACIFGAPLLWSSYEALSRKDRERQIASDLSGAIAGLKRWYEAL